MATAPDPRKFAVEEAATRGSIRVVLTVDDDDYTLRFGELTARDVRELREHGLTVSDVLTGVQSVVGSLDLFAAAVWLARRQAGEDVDFDKVIDGLRLDQVVASRDEDDAEPAEDFPDPPA